MKLFILLLSLSLTACADWQESLFEMGVNAERSMSDLTKHQVSTASHDWVYLDSASDGDSEAVKDHREVMLLLHGFAVDKDNWIRFARNFPDYRVIIPDLPGHGETSYNAEYVYDFDNQSLWLDEFISALDLNKFHIAGNSMGGGIAAFYSYNHPKKVVSITLIDAAGVHPPKLSKLQEIIKNKEENPLIVRSEADFDRLRDFAMEDQPFLPWPAPGVLARKAMARQSINDKIFIDINNYAERVKETQANLRILEAIKQPVFILWGKEDRALDVSSVEVFEKHLPNSSAVIMEGVGHGPMIERPVESAELVLHFMRSIKASKVINHLAIED